MSKIKKLKPYWKLRLNEGNFQRLLDYVIGTSKIYNENKHSIINNVIDKDYSTIEEVFIFLRKRQIIKQLKDITVEGAILGDFVPYDDWSYWCKKDIYKRYPKGEFSE